MKSIMEKALLAAICGTFMAITLVVCIKWGLLTPAHAEGATTVIQESIRTKRLEVCDATGKTRIQLLLTPQGNAGIAILDDAGVCRASLSVSKDGVPTLYTENQTTKTPSAVTPAPGKADNDGLSLIENQLVTDKFGNRYLTGSLRNNTDHDYKFVKVEYNLYDKDGAKLGTAMSCIEGLEANATWKFKAQILYQDTVSWKLKDYSGNK